MFSTSAIVSGHMNTLNVWESPEALRIYQTAESRSSCREFLNASMR